MGQLLSPEAPSDLPPPFLTRNYHQAQPTVLFVSICSDLREVFRVRTEARTRILTGMSEIRLHKNEVGGYAYNEANTILTQIKCVLERQLFKDSADGMKGLASDVSNALNDYKSNVHIKNRDVLAVSRAA